MIKAVAVSGIQETPLRTAGLALHARVAGVTLARVERALKQDKSLVTIWAIRGAPYIVPTREAAVFTTGALPAGEDSWRTFFGGWAASLSERNARISTLVRQAAQAAGQVLGGRQISVEHLRHEVAERMPQIRGLARPAGAHADLPEPLFRATGLAGVACIADTRQMSDALLARTDQWLGEPPPPVDQDTARAELLRRYLRCYGPSTHRAFADWTLRSVADARTVFDAIESELVQVRAERSTAWLLAADVDALSSPPEPTGARLLPTQDPFLQQRDRETLLPDREPRRRLWRPVGGPGLVLVDGRATGVWTSQRRGERLDVIVEPFGRLSKTQRLAISDEADSIAPIRAAQTTTLTIKR